MAGTSYQWVDMVDRALARQHVDLRAELARSGIELGDAGGRLGRDVTGAVWRVVDEHGGDPAFGVALARSVDYLEFGELGVAIVAAPDPEAALALMARHAGLLSEEVVITVERGPRTLELRIDHVRTHWRAAEFAAALVMRVLRVRFAPSLPVMRLALAFNNPPALGAYQRYFRGEVTMNAPATRLLLDRTVLARHGVPDPGGIASHFDALLARREAELAQTRTTADEVREALLEEFGPDFGAVDVLAGRLHLTPRTLQRRLRAEGTSASEVTDDVRRELAREWLHDGHLSHGEIAYRLGFAHQSSLSRALRRWWGHH
ncbi:MAG: AraC family transcriptional regulator ligand-binding domain-containing protein [Solirubrobacteraceae bacterium]|nr:AraC family transcriptional regulator ligand-binding domain-containing protein [Solirubrobacteraceae bacterium]